jgi:phosphatidylserine/phosphatidylglycerophosphate/cardiolipin synthase-like enzyme
MKTTILLAALMFLSTDLSAQTIYEIQGQSDASPYTGQTVNTGGIVTAVVVDGYFIQDGDGAWNGVYVYDQTQSPLIGDEVTFSATVAEYFTLTELDNVSNFEEISSGNALPTPVIITTLDVNQEAYEGVLITVESAVCVQPNMPFGEFDVDDGSGVARVDDLLYFYPAELGIAYHITGIGHFSFDFYKILPLGPDYVINATPLYFTIAPEEFDITTSSMNINWQTNAPATSSVSYGTTPDLELGTIEVLDMNTDHTIALTDLSPAIVYYLAIHSEDAENTTQVINRVVCSKSESSGTVNVFFNHEVNTSVATVSEATQSSDFVADILSYINLAETTLDITMYDTQGGLASIFEAINVLHDNGVIVRFITDSELENVELDLLNAEIPVLAGNSEGIMHDKFLVIDAGSVENSWVVTGSTNYTTGNLGWDFNNVICIQDQSLAKSFTLEFEEMWGSTSADFDVENALFGSMKTDNTPHKFVLDNIEAELYFSPSDNTEAKIGEALLDAENEIAFAVMAFTSNSLGSAIASQHNAGLDVQGIIDYVEFNGSEFDYLLGQGVDVIDYQNEDGTQWPDGPVLHHKYAIADYAAGSANPVTITGSHNWTASANGINDENTLLIYDHEIANWYYQEFTKRYDDLVSSLPELVIDSPIVYPNPASSSLFISRASPGNLVMYDMNGAQVLNQRLSAGNNEIDVQFLPKGTYIVRLLGDAGGMAKWVKN